MRATICDICETVICEVGEESELRFKHNDRHYELGVFRILAGSGGVRRRRADICFKCYINKLKEVVDKDKS